MGRAPCCDKANVKKGPWSPEEDAKLKEYIHTHGTGGNWIALPHKAGLKRCGKSCRLRWLNYLRPNIKHGEFSDEEDRIICTLFASIGSRWSVIAAQLPGRTDNDIKNYWNTKLKKKMVPMSMINKKEEKPSSTSSSSSPLSFTDSTTSSYYQYTHPHVFFTGPSSLMSNNSSASANSINFQTQDSNFMGLTHQNQIAFSSNMVGGEAASCSSSDGSCNNQIIMGHDVRDSEFNNNGYGEEDGSLIHNNDHIHKSGLWGENLLDYGIEEIKQLISSDSGNNFLFEEN